MGDWGSAGAIYYSVGVSTMKKKRVSVWVWVCGIIAVAVLLAIPASLIQWYVELRRWDSYPSWKQGGAFVDIDRKSHPAKNQGANP